MPTFRIEILLLSSLALLCLCSGTQVEYDANAFIIDGERRLIFSGAIHYPRSTPEMWPDLIQKAKDGGLDAIETYIFWDLHEPTRRNYDFVGYKDFIKFFQLIQQAGLYAILRIGPYVCAEWNYGGFPVWLHNTPGIQLRTDNQVYKNEMQIFTTKIVNMCKQAQLFAPQGGPIILAQIENEYGNIMKDYGEAGKSYIQWAAKMATSLNVGIPWIMCQQGDAPAPMINTCNGFYCDYFTPNNPKNPKMWTENWTGWFKGWGGKNPRRTAEDVAFAVARFFQAGGVFQNYYMYHGGTNFGRTTGGPYIATSYDYDAPLDEYGNLNQPKWGHLKNLHAAIKLGEKILTNSTSTTKNFGKGIDLTTYTSTVTGERFCYLGNTNTGQDVNVDLQQDGKYFVPAWSVSILQNCNKEIYNSAKLNVQTSVKETYPSGPEDGNTELSWMWAPEAMKDTMQGKGRFKASQLLEQKETTFDSSDYLWYMTSVDMNQTSSDNVTLQVKTNGHVLHAYVNRKPIGSQWGKDGKYSFTFEKPVSLKSGTNTITLLSATVGLQNYGASFDKVPTGLAGAQLIANGNALKDLSANQWFYKVGLNGEAKQLYGKRVNDAKIWRATGKLPNGRPMTWYKTTFKTPSGTDPVVVDLQGMGKGHAWVNGKSIGRFWPSFLAGEDGCSDTCDYRGEYKSEKCQTNCGNPTQRLYHIPRSFLNNDMNTLVLFEEIGGNPSNVTFQTVTVGTVCGQAFEGYTLELACQGGRVITDIQFASFGDPQGACGSFKKGTCETTNTFSAVERACIGKEACAIDASDATLGSGDCATKKLVVQAVCS